MNRKTVFVYAHWLGLDTPQLMGTLHAENLRGKQIFSFEYDAAWLRTPSAHHIDPDLGLFSGPQYIHHEQKNNFGIFLDSSPDRWGRLLMKRREAVLARMENRPIRTLMELDYLLGVYDEYRLGGLRFKEDINGAFINDNQEFAVPPWTRIRELEEISLKLEESLSENQPDYLNWINQLIAPGSSLGGARPKASVRDATNHLWIAKFPSLNDQTNMGGWEKVAQELAEMSGIRVAEGLVRKFSNQFSTYLSKRFDRTDNGERIHFASAMTLLGYVDGQGYREGASYLELAQFIITHGAKTKSDLEELWRRMVFNICISNTDDHLRNHGFLLSEHGWVLSPAYDLNPNEEGNGLSLNISEEDNSQDLNLAMDVHEYFRLSKPRALTILSEITSAVSKWREVAIKNALPSLEQDIKSPAFRTAT